MSNTICSITTSYLIPAGPRMRTFVGNASLHASGFDTADRVDTVDTKQGSPPRGTPSW